MRSNFIGQSLHTIDPKNRLFIPPKFRDALKDEGKNHFILTTVLGDCLSMFLPSEWDRIVAKLDQENVPNKEQLRVTKRLLFANATEVEVDGQGRVLLPQLLKDEAGLKKEVLINGAANKVELWDKKQWEAFKK